MKPLVCAALLCLGCVSSVDADGGYTIRPLGSFWYLLKLIAPVTLAPGERVRVIVYLDDIPGGVAGAPVLLARPMSGSRTDLTLSVTLFVPVPYGAYYARALVGGILSNDSADPVRYRITRCWCRAARRACRAPRN